MDNNIRFGCQCWENPLTIIYFPSSAFTNKKAVREMDSPFSFRCVNLTCFPVGAAEHLHSHGHGHWHHWKSRSEIHVRYFRRAERVCQWVLNIAIPAPFPARSRLFPNSTDLYRWRLAARARKTRTHPTRSKIERRGCNSSFAPRACRRSKQSE